MSVESTAPLTALAAALRQFSDHTRETLAAVSAELRRVGEWLAERHRHWQVQVGRRRTDLQRARASLAACQAMAAVSGRGGYSCAAAEAAVMAALVRLREAEAEVDKIVRWMKLLNEASAEYQREAARLAAALDQEVPRARAFLDGSVAALEGYPAIELASKLGGEPAVGGAGEAGGAGAAVRQFQTVPPTHAIWTAAAGFIAAGATGKDGLAGTASGFMSFRSGNRSMSSTGYSPLRLSRWMCWSPKLT